MGARAARRRLRARAHVRRARGDDTRAVAAAAPSRGRHRIPRPRNAPDLARGHLREARGAHMTFNAQAVRAIYGFEMARFRRTLFQSVVTPVITTSLYFVVFGAAIGPRMATMDSVPYGAFIVPGLVMLAIFTESLNNASF